MYKNFIISNLNEPITVEALLRDYWGLGRKFIHLIRMEKGVHKNNTPLRFNEEVNNGDLLSIYIPNIVSKVRPRFGEIDVIFEDEHTMVVNKRPGIKVHPNSESETGTLNNFLAQYFSDKDEMSEPRHIHRLDKDTSGAVIFAKHVYSQSIMDQMLAEREIKRTYIAVCDGVFEEDYGKIDEPIDRVKDHPTKREASIYGDRAVTNYKVLKRAKRHTLVEFELETGRTHQIRVHCEFLGHSVTGDKLYGSRDTSINRQALHANSVKFKHPFTHEEIFCEAEVPKDMALLIDKLF
jgi:23S rRNA pseudouridine1911/1915/1917 synthase